VADPQVLLAAQAGQFPTRISASFTNTTAAESTIIAGNFYHCIFLIYRNIVWTAHFIKAAAGFSSSLSRLRCAVVGSFEASLVDQT